MKTDAEIRDDVTRELQWEPQLSEPDAIGVAARDGAVTLTGTHPATPRSWRLNEQRHVCTG